MDSAQLPKLLLTSLETAVTLISTCEQKEKTHIQKIMKMNFIVLHFKTYILHLCVEKCT